MHWRMILGFVLVGISNQNVYGSTVRIEVVQEQERRETRMFCSRSSETSSKNDCLTWLEEQKKTLGDRVLTSYCGYSVINTDIQTSPCLYRTVGEIKYVLRSYRTETRGN